MAGQQRGMTLPQLRAWRDKRLLTQDELAHKVGVTIGTIWRAERGASVNKSTARKLAEALEVTPDELCREAAQPVTA